LHRHAPPPEGRRSGAREEVGAGDPARPPVSVGTQGQTGRKGEILMRMARAFVAVLALSGPGALAAQPEAPKPNPKFDADLARKYGADENGMKTYVLAILKTGKADVAPGKGRDEIFKGHFANIRRLAAEGKLAVAGPFGTNGSGLRGIFILNVP